MGRFSFAGRTRLRAENREIVKEPKSRCYYQIANDILIILSYMEGASQAESGIRRPRAGSNRKRMILGAEGIELRVFSIIDSAIYARDPSPG
jgi:hypothetical protein